MAVAANSVCQVSKVGLILDPLPTVVSEQNFFSWPKSDLSLALKICWQEGGAREKFKTREGLSHRTILYHCETKEMIGGKEGTGSRRWQWGDGREQRGKIYLTDIFRGEMR